MIKDVSVESRIDKTALVQMLDKVDELPLLPQVLVKIMQLDKSAADYFEQFEKLAKEDPPFAVRVVALANSAASAPINPIVSIKEAIIRMGSATIGSLVASLSVQRVFMPSKPGQIRLWEHSIITAVAAERIALLLPQLHVDIQQAYLAGLLHDIGRFVMLEHAAPHLQEVDESHWSSPEDLVAADVKIFTYTHSELGYMACHKWGLPDSLAQVVRKHHRLLKVDVAQDPSSAITFCVQMADKLAIALLENPELDELDADARMQILHKKCVQSPQDKRLLCAEDLYGIIDDIQIESQAILSGLGFAGR